MFIELFGITIFFIFFIFAFESVEIFIAHKKKRCEDCGKKNVRLIISRYTISAFGMVKPAEWRCVYHYRMYHNVKTDDFTTELDANYKEWKELQRLYNNI